MDSFCLFCLGILWGYYACSEKSELIAVLVILSMIATLVTRTSPFDWGL